MSFELLIETKCRFAEFKLYLDPDFLVANQKYQHFYRLTTLDVCFVLFSYIKIHINDKLSIHYISHDVPVYDILQIIFTTPNKNFLSAMFQNFCSVSGLGRLLTICLFFQMNYT